MLVGWFVLESLPKRFTGLEVRIGTTNMDRSVLLLTSKRKACGTFIDDIGNLGNGNHSCLGTAWSG